MSNLDEGILKDIELARKKISESENSFVVVQYNKIWKEKKEYGVKPLFETIKEMKEDINGAVIGINFLDKASAFLCRYAKVSGVYAPSGTKTGIAILIMAGIPSEIDEMIPNVQNTENKSVCFDKLLDGVESPKEAYKIIEEKIGKKGKKPNRNK